MSSKPPTITKTAHTFSASHSMAAPAIFSSHEAIEPMMPGRTAAAFPAIMASRHPRLCSCFLTQSLGPPLSDGGGMGDGVDPPVSASTSVLMINPEL